jgi:hypothetical protein
MTEFFQDIFKKYPHRSQRVLEIFPGALTWIVVLFPVWGSLFFPSVLAYFILFFDVYWFYKSYTLVINAQRAAKRIKRSEAIDWLERAKTQEHYNRAHHILVIPNYKERVEKMRITLEALALQTLPHKKIHIVLGMEERETEGRERAEKLISEFGHTFGSVFATYHPDLPGEVKGKSSNEAFAGREAYKILIENGPLDLDYTTVTSVDADAIFDPQYFAYLTYDFLKDAKRYNKFWQSATVFYSNIWKVPAPIRIISFFGSLYRTALLVQGDRLITQSTYSLSFKLLKDIDFWDVDVIPEDYRIFFKAFYRMKGQIWTEPIFLKTSMDAAYSEGYINSLKNKYHQERRWAWGVSDNPLFIKWWLTVPDVPFFRKTVLIGHVVIDHLLWPVNWFIITIAANIMPFLNPVYSRTTLGYMLPQIAGLILTSTLFAIVALIIIDYRSRPKGMPLPWWRHIIFPLEFIMMPLVGFFLSALPALISHTNLMMGKRLEYKVTDKA